MNKSKNVLETVNDLLIAQMIKISESKLSGDALQEEVTRSKALCCSADKIIQSHNLQLKSIDLALQMGLDFTSDELKDRLQLEQGEE